jgi:undecaprenyl-phosphate 4-deoxy-4-formamido-L-arabinose transferase
LIALHGDRYRLELVLVNDCSKDGSDAVCKKLHDDFPDTVHYLRLSRNFGEQGAVLAGLHHASGEYCVIMDDDFQNPPEEVSALLDKMELGYDVVYSRYEVKNDARSRNLGSKFNDWFATLALKKPKDLYLSSFKVVNRFLVDEIKKFTGSFPYIDAIILRTTSSIGTVTVRHDPRRTNKSGYSWSTLFALGGNMIIGFSLYPIRVISVIGIIVLLFGTARVIEDIALTLFPPVEGPPDDISGLSAMLLFFRGLQLLVTGIIGEYAGRLYMNFNNAPLFVIREQLIPKPAIMKSPVFAANL